MIKTQQVYIIENPSAGIIKIGISEDVEKRLLNLQNACGQKLNVLFITKGVPAAYELEQQLHLKFKAKRLYGEWFDLPNFKKKDLGSKKGWFHEYKSPLN